MRISSSAFLVLAGWFLVGNISMDNDRASIAVVAKKPPSSSSSRSRSAASARSRGGSSSSSSRRPPSSSKPRYLDEDDEYGDSEDDVVDEFDEEEDDEVVDEFDVEVEEFDGEEDDDIDEDEEEEDYRPTRPRPSPKTKGSQRRGPPRSSSSKKRPSSSRRGGDYYDDRPRRPNGPSRKGSRGGPPPSRSSGRGRGGRGPPPRGRVVPYTRKPQRPSTFVRGMEALRSSMPDPTTVKDAAMKSLTVARETTSSLSTNLYREVKGLASSDLEQTMLKATRPDDTAAKGKHTERLVGLTYQVASQFQIYDAVLRKLAARVAEKDWRTNIKALYILHRFSADGSPQHAQSLKLKLREIRRMPDPKRKGKYFSAKILTNWDTSPESKKFQDFTERYAHYVLLRAQAFAGMFDEIRNPPGQTAKERRKKTPPRPITMTSLKEEHLSSARKLLNDGVACELRKGEECENTAIAVERVAADLQSLTAAVATALTAALNDDDAVKKGADPVLLKKWCEFYSEELLPKSRAMVKRTTPKLDAYGLYLPARQKATLSPDLLQKGLKLDETSKSNSNDNDAEESTPEGETKDGGDEDTDSVSKEDESTATTANTPLEDEEVDDVEDLEDEYEYEEEEEYYDDEEEEEEEDEL